MVFVVLTYVNGKVCRPRDNELPMMAEDETSSQSEVRFAASKPLCRIMRGCIPSGMDSLDACDQPSSPSGDEGSASDNGVGGTGGSLIHRAIDSNSRKPGERPSIGIEQDGREPRDRVKPGS